jgi:hypothetical protein
LGGDFLGEGVGGGAVFGMRGVNEDARVRGEGEGAFGDADLFGGG